MLEASSTFPSNGSADAPRRTPYMGVGVVPGRVLAPVRQMTAAVQEPPFPGGSPAQGTLESQSQRIKDAAKAVQTDLRSRAATASGEAKNILSATALMATDPMLVTSAIKLLSSPDGARTPERAVWEAGSGVAEMLSGLGGYMAERVSDILDVRARIVCELRGEPAPGIPYSEQPFILVAEDLAPADTATLDPRKVLALVTASGGPQSHTAILARALGLPAVVAAPGVQEIPDGQPVYVDGAVGIVNSSPGEEQQRAAESWAASASSLKAFSGSGRTADGFSVPLLANVGSAADAALAAVACAEGVGLLRTEFCFLNRDTEPTTADQVEAYGGVFEAFPGRKVVVRTLDAGADKPLPFLSNLDEPNPALGVRGYRAHAGFPGVLERQLQAIATAAASHTAEVWVMAPMISTAEEAAEFASLCLGLGLATPGVMVEVPSAALTASSVLGEVDFASIGTNDLTQYAMAADRQLGSLAALNDPWQPAVLQLVRLTVEGAAAAGAADGKPKSVGVCGEAAADPALAVVLVGLGIATLSMSARALGPVSAVLSSVTVAQARELAAVALRAPTAAAARSAVRSALPLLSELGL